MGDNIVLIINVAIHGTVFVLFIFGCFIHGYIMNFKNKSNSFKNSRD
jgi:hypothetical protein